MLERLLLGSLVFHVFNGLAAAALFLLWRRRYPCGASGPLLLARPVLEIAALGTVAAGTALVVGLGFRLTPFGVLHLATQWIFGEFALLLAGAAWLFFRAGWKHAAAFPLILLVTQILVGIDAFIIEPRALDVSEHDLSSSRINPSNAEKSAGGALRIVHISDLQTPRIGAREREAFRRAMDLRPDLIVLTGDYIHALAGIEDQEAARRDLRTLLGDLPWPPLGIYAVKGDTEGNAWPSMFAGTRVVTLSDTAARVPLPSGRSHLSILGLNPHRARGADAAGTRRLVRSLPRDDLRLVIGHSPDFVMALETGTVDLALGGHTHGGQIVLPMFGPPITLSKLPRFMARGLHEWRGTPIHVSAGVGMERGFAPQVRFLCRPEICLLRVRPGALERPQATDAATKIAVP